MRISRPSPAMVVAIISLVVATAGTATAAGVIIRSSGQVARGSINGGDLAKKTVTPRNIDDNAVRSRHIKDGSIGKDKLDKSLTASLSGGGGGAIEAVRESGPTLGGGGRSPVAKLTGLQPGAYLLSAKTVIAPTQGSGGIVGELLKNNQTAVVGCTLDGAGDNDTAVAPIGSPFSLYSNTLNVQLTRTISQTSDLTLICDSAVPWQAGETSIIAVPLGSVTRQESTG